MFASVSSSTHAKDSYWAVECLKVPAATLYLMLDMGAVRDFYKPVQGATWCQMLQSNTLHQWSRNGLDWFIPSYFGGVNGGSAVNWPRDTVENDARKHLSMWGDCDACHWGKGGCCSTSTSVYDISWGMPFTFAYGLPLHPLPPNVGMSLVADVAGTTVANDAFWAEKCMTIPSSTKFIVLDMGAVRDFFKPTEGSTYCDMLQAHNKHQWSPNGVDWVAVAFFGGSDHNGGSANWWPRDKGVEGDARKHLSFWGVDDGRKGGWGSTSTAVGWHYLGRWGGGAERENNM